MSGRQAKRRRREARRFVAGLREWLASDEARRLTDARRADHYPGRGGW